MGYQLIEVKPDFTFFTVTFKNVGTESIDLLDILCKQANGEDWLTTSRTHPEQVCNGAIKVQKMYQNSGNFDVTYSYYSGQTTDKSRVIGWSRDGVTPLERNKVMIKPGEGLIVQNGKGISGAFLVSGEVSLGTQYDVPPNFSFSGNCTPVKIDLLDILCKQANGEDWLTSSRTYPEQVCNGAIKVQKMFETSGNYDVTYAYYSGQTSDKSRVIGWSRDGVTPLERNKVMLEPGEGIIVQNGKNVSGLFVFPNPIKDSAK